MHFDTIQVSVLAVANLEDDLSLETSLPFDFHQIGKDRSAVGVEVMMLEVNPLSGRPLQIKVAQDSSGTLFVVGGAQ